MSVERKKLSKRCSNQDNTQKKELNFYYKIQNNKAKKIYKKLLTYEVT